MPSLPPAPRPVAVLGGGIAGLTAAWHLQRRGVPVVVLEAGSRAGGVIDSKREGEWLWETGPNTLFENSEEIRRFVSALRLDGRCLEASPLARHRYVVHGGRPVALPGSALDFVRSPLLSWSAKLRLLGEPFRRAAAEASDESVAEFVTRRLGPEFLDYIVNPFVAGIYAGDPAELSVRHAFPKLHALEQEHGSLARGSLARRNASGGPRGRMVSFPDGLAEIPRALARELGFALRLNHRVTRLARTAAGWRVAFSATGMECEEDFSAVVCTLPPAKLAGLGWPQALTAAAVGELRTVHQPPVASVFLGFRREDVAHALDGFGFLAPAVEQRRILGTLFSSTLFAGRAPAGHVALTTFVGGTRQPELEEDDAAPLAVAVVGGACAVGQGGHVVPRVLW